MKINNNQNLLVECDVQNFEISEKGIDDYYWPISNKERTGFGLYLIKEYADLIKKNENNSNENIILYEILGMQFLHEIICIFQGDLLKARIKSQNLEINVPSDWRYWSNLLKDLPPPEPNLIQILKNKKSDSKNKFINPLFFLNKAKKYFSIKNKKSEFGQLKIKIISDNVLNNNIIATQRTPLILEHAQESKKDVVFCRSGRWFNAISDEKYHIVDNESLNSKIINIISNGYKNYNIQLETYNEKFICNFIVQAVSLALVHYKRLLENTNSLPREIWTGTTGNFWDTMLRLAVVHNGGVATAHDHGSGWSYLTHPLRGINELWGSQYFYSFNDFHAKEMQRMAPQWPHYEEKIPEIIAPKKQSPDRIKNYNKFINNHDTKTIFIMGDVYDNDRTRVGPGTPNNFLVDTQARLISILKNAGYDVVIKMHPESKVAPPKAYEEKLGARVSWIPFSQVKEEADLILFLCIYSTAFTEALLTNIPVLLFDTFGFPWTQTGQELIEKRCAIYRAGYKNNRAQIDQDQLLKAIKRASLKSNNHEFFEKYFL